MSCYKRKKQSGELTIDFELHSTPHSASTPNVFHHVKSEMLKRRERLRLRKKPIEYQKLQQSLQEKLKKKSFNLDAQRQDMSMLQKCKNYFQMRRPHPQSYTTPATPTKKKRPTRPMTQASPPGGKIGQRLQSVMKECEREGESEAEVKENMDIFTFYCRTMDKRLEGMRTTIDKKGRVI